MVRIRLLPFSSSSCSLSGRSKALEFGLKKLTWRQKERSLRKRSKSRRTRRRDPARLAVLTTDTGRRLVRLSSDREIPRRSIGAGEGRDFAFFHDLRLRTMRRINGLIRLQRADTRDELGGLETTVISRR